MRKLWDLLTLPVRLAWLGLCLLGCIFLGLVAPLRKDEEELVEQEADEAAVCFELDEDDDDGKPRRHMLDFTPHEAHARILHQHAAEAFVPSPELPFVPWWERKRA